MRRRIPKKLIYHIILTSWGKEIKHIAMSSKESLAYKKLNKLVDDNRKNLKFPVRYINCHGLKDANYELVLIKCRDENDPHEVRIRDEYGRYVPYASDDSNWIIIDRARFYREESFWVYGFHPTLQRKDFMWVYENFIAKDCSKTNFKNVVVYKNKLLVDFQGSLRMVLCKNKDDSVRLFNQLEEYAMKDKLKYIVWGGDVTNSYDNRQWVSRIMDLTGWNNKKVRRASLRP